MSHPIIVISDFPLPPSVNEGYRNVPGVGRVATEHLKNFRKSVDDWRQVHGRSVVAAFQSLLLKEWAGHRAFRVSYNFVFKHERLFCTSKKLMGKPKKLDADSRIKFAQDSLFNALGIDDCHVFSGEFRKLSGEVECTVITIQPDEPMTSVELFQSFNNEAPTTNSEQ